MKLAKFDIDLYNGQYPCNVIVSNNGKRKSTYKVYDKFGRELETCSINTKDDLRIRMKFNKIIYGI